MYFCRRDDYITGHIYQIIKVKCMAKEEKQKVRREKRAAFFYDISKMFLAGSGVSGLSPLLFGE